MRQVERAMYSDLVTKAARGPYIHDVIAWMPEDRSRMFRVTVHDDGRCHVETFTTLEPLDGHDFSYQLGEEPRWITDRIVVLRMSTKPPHKPIEDIGLRISENIFWIVAPEKK